MEIKLVTEPSVEPVLTAGLKLQLGIESSFTADDTLLVTIEKAARRHIERRTKRALITQTWDLFLDDWPYSGDNRQTVKLLDPGDYFEFPWGKLQSVTHVKYKDSDGDQTTWDSSDYIVDINADPGRLVLADSASWPTGALYPTTPIVARYVCGYGDAGSDVEPDLIQAIGILAGDMYEKRLISKVPENSLVDEIIEHYIIYGLKVD